LLLSFLAEHAGFAVVKTVRLQEDPSLHTDKPLRLIDVLDGASPDYGVIAQKAAPEDVLERFREPFGRDFGLSLGQLAQRFDEANAQQHRQLRDALERREQQVSALAMQCTDCSTRLQHVQEQGRDMDRRLAELSQQLATVEAGLAAAKQQLDSELASTSWRLTKPLRWLGRFLR
jgi:O-antigen chain-terminating methyltransferase